MKRLSEFMDGVEQNLLFNNDEFHVASEVLSIYWRYIDRLTQRPWWYIEGSQKVWDVL